MSRVKVGIIGSAGRHDDAMLVTRYRYKDVVKYVQNFIQRYDSVELVSGGAAFIDHVAVSLFIMSFLRIDNRCKLTLYLPTTFNVVSCCYNNNNVGSVSNYYHREFSKSLRDPPNKSLNTLSYLFEFCSSLFKSYTYNGFKERNIAIANRVDVLLAFTAHRGDEPKPKSGTLHTWNAANGSVTKVHHDLRDFG